MDVIVAGGGRAAAECRGLLSCAGYEVGDNLAQDGCCPVILGEVPHPFSEAAQLVESGRHQLIASPVTLSAAQVGSLLAARAPRQALFFWSESRHHPAYRLLSGLIRSDEYGWRPHHLRHASLSLDRANAGLLRWRTSEALATLLSLVETEPGSLAARGYQNSHSGTWDFLAVALYMGDVQISLEVGLGEAMESRATVVASGARKAYIEEMDRQAPVRIAAEDRAGGPRLICCPAPSASEMARLQCLAFIEATTNTGRAQREADLWVRVISCWRAIERSLAADGARMTIDEPVAAKLRVLFGRLAAPARTLSAS